MSSFLDLRCFEKVATGNQCSDVERHDAGYNLPINIVQGLIFTSS